MGSVECNSTTCSESPSLLIRDVDLSVSPKKEKKNPLERTLDTDASAEPSRESSRCPFLDSEITPLETFSNFES